MTQVTHPVMEPGVYMDIGKFQLKSHSHDTFKNHSNSHYLFSRVSTGWMDAVADHHSHHHLQAGSYWPDQFKRNTQ